VDLRVGIDWVWKKFLAPTGVRTSYHPGVYPKKKAVAFKMLMVFGVCFKMV
jgi:hypothetical protein